LTEKEKILFERLKKEVAKTFLKENTALSTDISKWKGDDIVRFQEDLLHKVKGRVSEKWFYNYFRNEIQKLPRIDMLNLLSQYAGYQNWAEFIKKNSVSDFDRTIRYRWGIAGLIGLLLIAVGFMWYQQADKEVVFYLIDENNTPVTTVKVTWLLPDETEKVVPVTDNFIRLETALSPVRLRLESPYYKDKLIQRNITSYPYKETLVLQTDVVALLLQYYSDSITQNWQKRKEKLSKLISPDALIYRQWFGNHKGIEVYEKDDFIAQMCLPNGMIKNIKILEIGYKDNKINKLRFTLKKDKDR